jgi:hypothetical protein
MKIKDLMQTSSFKNSFNAVYKNYYKNRKLPEHLMVELSMEYQDLFNALSNDERTIEDVVDFSELSALVLYSLHQKK